MFLADINTAFFSNNTEDNPNIVGSVSDAIIGKTIPGMITRGIGLQIGAAALGMKMRPKTNISTKVNPYAKYQRRIAMRNAGNIIRTGAGVAGGTLVGGGALHLAKKEYDRRNRKWWEFL